MKGKGIYVLKREWIHRLILKYLDVVGVESVLLVVDSWLFMLMWIGFNWIPPMIERMLYLVYLNPLLCVPSWFADVDDAPES